jgi:translation initiation factor IF-3
VKIKNLPKVNYEIRAQRVKLIDENRHLLGEFEIKDAVRFAREKGFDLVEVGPESTPPICRLMDFGRYVYEKKRQERESHKHVHRPRVREMRFSLKISDHDYQVKLNKTKEFLNDGDRVKVKLRLRGREMLHSNLGMKVLERVVTDLDAIAKPEAPPKQEENIIMVNFLPQKRREHNEQSKDEKRVGEKS